MYQFNQIRGWQWKKVLMTADSMAALAYWIPSEVILTVKGLKGDSNIESTLKTIGLQDDAVIHIGNHKAIGATILAKAAADDAKAKKGSCKVICDGNHKALAKWLTKAVAGIDLDPIEREVDADMAKRIADEANLAQRTGAELAKVEILESIIRLRKAKIYTKQADLPFGQNDRGNHQNFWWRSEAVITAGYEVAKVQDLKWQVAKRLCEGVPYDTAILEMAEKKNANKIVTAESVKMVAQIANNFDPDAKLAPEVTGMLRAAAAGDNDGFRQLATAFYAKLKVEASAKK